MSKNLNFELLVPLGSSLYNVCFYQRSLTKPGYIPVKAEENVWFSEEWHMSLTIIGVAI
jgi:hypothetical protein